MNSPNDSSTVYTTAPHGTLWYRQAARIIQCTYIVYLLELTELYISSSIKLIEYCITKHLFLLLMHNRIQLLPTLHHHPLITTILMRVFAHIYLLGEEWYAPFVSHILLYCDPNVNPIRFPLRSDAKNILYAPYVLYAAFKNILLSIIQHIGRY